MLLKSKNPLVSLLMGLIVIAMMYFMLDNMQQVMNVGEEEEVFDVGESFLSKSILEPFKNKWEGERTIEGLKVNFELMMGVVAESERGSYAGYLAHQVRWPKVFSSSDRYIGTLMPTYAEGYAPVKGIDQRSGWAWVELTIEGVALSVLVGDDLPEINSDDQVYLDLFYLGELKNKEGVLQHVGIARKMYALPRGGRYPRMKSDAIALNEVVDDFKLPEETRIVSTYAFHHYLAKIQDGEDRTEEFQKGVGYRELMESPDRYRGKVVAFTGSLMFYQRRKMAGNLVTPGMDFFYQCYLLDSNRIEYIVRTLSLPEGVKLRDIVQVKGYFLQRINFLNRMDRATWVPLLISGDMTIQKEKEFGLSGTESRVILPIIVVGLLLFCYLTMRVTRAKKRIKLKVAPDKLRGVKAPVSKKYNRLKKE